MKRALWQNFSLCTCNLLIPPPKFKPNANPLFVPFAASSRFRLRPHSSKTESSNETNFAQTQKRDGSIDDVDSISNPELKKQIEKFYEGDDEALPSIFEAILKRKLAGIRDDELAEELGLKPPIDDVEDKEFDSDFDAPDESDDEIDD